MKTFLVRFLSVIAALLSVGQGAFAAVTFTNTPSVISNTFSGLLTLQIGGVPTGDAVVVQKYLDANTNNIIDGGDWLVQQFNLTDGASFVIGGVTNLNVPGDLNATTGAITAQLNFVPPSLNGDVAQSFVGKYLFRLSSPAAHFTPITNIFAVTNFPFLQTVNGIVRSNAVGVANAVVLAFQPSGDGLNPVSGTVADNAGNYSLKLPVGTYFMVPFRSNFLANLSAAPTITLTASATITTNLFLTNATQKISGRLIDASNSALALPGIGVPATDTNNFISFCTSDTNGNYTASTRPSVWKIGGDSAALAVHGYLSLQNKVKTNSAAGSITGLNLPFPKATAMFYGTVKDNLNNPLPGVLFFSQDNSNFLYEDNAVSGTNGTFFAGALAGDWQFYVDNNNPAYSNYVFSLGTTTTLVSNQAMLVNFTAILGTRHISGTVRDSNNNPIVGVQVLAGANLAGTDYQSLNSQTDSGGNYSLTVPDGNWSVFIPCNGGNNSLDAILGFGNYQCPNNQVVNVAGGNATNNFVVQLCNGVSITTTSLLPSGQAGSSYDVTLQASSCSPGYSWLQTAGSIPGGMTFETWGQLHGVPNTGGSFNFTAQVTDGASHTTNQTFALTITTNSVPPPPVSIAGAGGQVVVFYPLTGSNYVLETTTNVATGPWVPATNGVSVIALTFSNTAPVQFFRLH